MADEKDGLVDTENGQRYESMTADKSGGKSAVSKHKTAMNKSLIRLLFEAMVPYIIAVLGFGIMLAILVLDLSRNTMILIYATMQGVALGLLMITLFAAMILQARS